MRKGLYIEGRDLRLLGHMSLGPSTRASIFENIFDTENGNKATRQRVMMRRLAKHEEAGLIRSATCPSVRDRIYFLTAKAAPIVASRYGRDISEIWTRFNEKTLEHDLYAAFCGRKIQQTLSKATSRISVMVPECGLRNGRRKKGVYYPDIFFRVRNEETSYYLEVDCGTISRADFTGKMNSFDGTILVVTKTKPRANFLMWSLRMGNIAKPVHIVTLMDFYKNDLETLKWRSNISGEEETLSLFAGTPASYLVSDSA